MTSAPAVSTPPSQPTTQSIAQPSPQPAAPVSATTPPGVARRGRHSPVLAQASASTAAVAAVAVTAPVASMAASVAPPAPLITPMATPSTSPPTTPDVTPSIDVVSSTPAQSSDDIAENQLADFEDNLAMNLGETLVAEDEPSANKSDLANEMDELLSEITSGGRS